MLSGFELYPRWVPLSRAPKMLAVASNLAFLSVLLEILQILLWVKVNVILYGA